jgi:hypothetical protein
VIAFLVRLPVVPLDVVRLEGQVQVIGDLFVCKLLEAARAAGGSHVVVLSGDRFKSG